MLEGGSLQKSLAFAGPLCSRLDSSALDSCRVACAESRSLRPDRWDWLEVREYLVLKHDGTTVRYPVTGGDVAQARLRAALSQRPNDEIVVVTDDAYFRIGSAGRSHGRFRLSDADIRTGRSTAS